MVDATKVSSIKINTGYDGEREYSIFTRVNSKGENLEDAQCVIILGKNSSGKSTIARALDGGSNVEFFNKDRNSLGGDCSNVYVFDIVQASQTAFHILQPLSRNHHEVG